jgi:hypothetical protein
MSLYVEKSRCNIFYKNILEQFSRESGEPIYSNARLNGESFDIEVSPSIPLEVQVLNSTL